MTPIQQAAEDFRSTPKAERHSEEAKFGRLYVEPAIKQLGAGSRVLEIGCGAGILLSQLAVDYPTIDFLGLEPTGEGFSYGTDYHAFANTLANAEVRPVGYEDLGHNDQASSSPGDNNRYDLIYLVNVFEHLPSWADLLERLENLLSEDGQCMILCPNYSFPYEPHFRLPLLFGKKMSYRALRRRIERHEAADDCAGLWNSLNFVTLRSVKAKCESLGLSLEFQRSIIDDMVTRLDTDAEFSQRQGILRLPVWAARKSGAIRVLQRSSPLDNWLPYLFLIIRRTTPT